MAFVGKLLAFACLLYVVCINCEPMEIWGDITTTTIVGSVKSKYAIPFFTRSVTITYPNVSIFIVLLHFYIMTVWKWSFNNVHCFLGISLYFGWRSYLETCVQGIARKYQFKHNSWYQTYKSIERRSLSIDNACTWWRTQRTHSNGQNYVGTWLRYRLTGGILHWKCLTT